MFKFVLLFLFLFSTQEVYSNELKWPIDIDLNKTKGFTVHIGDRSREYKKTLKITTRLHLDFNSIPLEGDVINYLSLSVIKEGVEFYSSEIIILWTKLVDSDKDGLSDFFENKIGTNPNNPDSDADGLPDGLEYATWGAERSILDYDEDGVINILDPDSDDDGIIDSEDLDTPWIDPNVFFTREKLKNNPVYTSKTRNKSVRLTWNKIKKTPSVSYKIYTRQKGGVFDRLKPIWEGGKNEANINFQENNDLYIVVVAVDNGNGKEYITNQCLLKP